MAVDGKLRRYGFARLMLAAAEGLAAAQGGRQLYLHARLADAPAQQLYLSSGCEGVACGAASAGGAARALGQAASRLALPSNKQTPPPFWHPAATQWLDETVSWPSYAASPLVRSW